MGSRTGWSSGALLAACAFACVTAELPPEPLDAGAHDASPRDAGAVDASVDGLSRGDGGSCAWGEGTFGHTLQIASAPGGPSTETSTSVEAEGELRAWFPMLRIDLDDGREVRGYLSLGGAALPPAPSGTRARVALAIDGERAWRLSVFELEVDGVVYGLWRSTGAPLRVGDAELVELPACLLSDPLVCAPAVTALDLRVTRGGEARTVAPGEWAEAPGLLVVNGRSFAAPEGTTACVDGAPSRQSEGLLVLR